MADQTNGHTNGAGSKITLYTNHGCPFAHRAHITLRELGVPYEEVIIDLKKPREPWYLDINPRGLVPSIKYSGGPLDGEILTESAIIIQYLADSFESHLLPAPNSSPKANLFRARVAFFTDTWSSKVQSHWYKVLFPSDEAEGTKSAEAFVAAVKKEIEPLLEGAAPYFGGSESLTLAEATVIPHVIRVYSSVKGGLAPASIKEGLDALPNFSSWVAAASAEKSVTYVYDEDTIIENTKARIAKANAERKEKI